MIDVVTLETAHLFGAILPSIYRLRHRIFVERQRYDVPTFHGMEWDQFDTPAAVYLVWRDCFGEALGVARLIPTTFPYMVQRLWPELVETTEVPVSPRVWEVTRLGVDKALDPQSRKQVIGELVCAFAEFGLRNAISEYIFVTPRRVIENALTQAGLVVTQLGQQKKLGGLPVVAARSSVSREALMKLRRFHGISQPVLNYPNEPHVLAA
jgi:acyl homoserine lactone synthase